MDMMTERKAMTIMRRLASRGRTKPLTPQKQYKPLFDASAEHEYFERVSPESQGISSEMICDFLCELTDDRRAAINTVSVLRNGKMICEAAKYPYRLDIPHVCYSFSKTVTGIAVYMLIDEGRLSPDESVQRIFADIKPAVINPLQRGLKVKHLMDMTSGIRFNEFAVVTETDWVRCFLESVPKAEPGAVFEYNSMNSYMLSAIVTKKTGLTLPEYLETRLFAPLGIENKYWSSCPCGISCGGWGLYLLPEDMVKIGQFILQRGEWEGRQLLPKELVDEMCRKHSDVPNAVSSYNYGHQIWVSDDPKMLVINGMFGQNTLIFPESDIVITLTAGNENIFHDNIAFEICTKYFGGIMPFTAPIKQDRKSLGVLKDLQRSLGEPTSKRKRAGALPPECGDWDGTAYLYKSIESASTGILPLTVQCSHNCFAKGIRRIAFDITAKRFMLTVAEGNSVYKLPVGFGKAEPAGVNIGDDSYRLAIIGRFMIDENDNEILLVKLHFVEMGAVRIFRFEPHGDEMLTTFSEMPGADFFSSGVSHMLCDIKDLPVVKNILSGGGNELLKFAAQQAFKPTAVGIRMR